MRRCRVEVSGIEFILKYKDFMYELMLAIELNTGLQVNKLSWNTGNTYIATLRNGLELPVVIHSDRRVG